MRLDCRQRKAMLLTSVLRRQNADLQGAGVPSGTPPFNGARYLDTTTGVVYLGRNVLNFNTSASILTPTIFGVRRVAVRFWHNDPSPSAIRQLWDGTETLQTRARREATTGNLNGVSSISSQALDGATITNNAVNPSASVWHTYTLTSSSDRQFGFIGRTNAGGLLWSGRIADVQVLGAGDVLLASYAIDEGSGTTIIDSVGGQNGTLTLGSGSWELTWVPQN